MSEFWTRVEDGLPELNGKLEVPVFFIDSGGFADSGHFCDGEDEPWGRGFYNWESVWQDEVIAWAYVPPLEKK
jgi:hypothetical protein